MRVLWHSYLSSSQSQAAITCPSNGQTLTSQWNAGSAGFASDIPEAASAVTGHGCQLSFLRRVPRNAFNASGMTAKLSAVLHLWLLRVPYAKGTVGGPCCNQVAGGIPRNGANTTWLMSGKKLSLL